MKQAKTETQRSRQQQSKGVINYENFQSQMQKLSANATQLLGKIRGFPQAHKQLKKTQPNAYLNYYEYNLSKHSEWLTLSQRVQQLKKGCNQIQKTDVPTNQQQAKILQDKIAATLSIKSLFQRIITELNNHNTSQKIYTGQQKSYQNIFDIVKSVELTLNNIFLKMKQCKDYISKLKNDFSQNILSQKKTKLSNIPDEYKSLTKYELQVNMKKIKIHLNNIISYQTEFINMCKNSYHYSYNKYGQVLICKQASYVNLTKYFLLMDELIQVIIDKNTSQSKNKQIQGIQNAVYKAIKLTVPLFECLDKSKNQMSQASKKQTEIHLNHIKKTLQTIKQIASQSKAQITSPKNESVLKKSQKKDNIGNTTQKQQMILKSSNPTEMKNVPQTSAKQSQLKTHKQQQQSKAEKEQTQFKTKGKVQQPKNGQNWKVQSGNMEVINNTTIDKQTLKQQQVTKTDQRNFNVDGLQNEIKNVLDLTRQMQNALKKPVEQKTWKGSYNYIVTYNIGLTGPTIQKMNNVFPLMNTSFNNLLDFTLRLRQFLTLSPQQNLNNSYIHPQSPSLTLKKQQQQQQNADDTGTIIHVQDQDDKLNKIEQRIREQLQQENAHNTKQIEDKWREQKQQLIKQFNQSESNLNAAINKANTKAQQTKNTLDQQQSKSYLQGIQTQKLFKTFEEKQAQNIVLKQNITKLQNQLKLKQKQRDSQGNTQINSQVNENIIDLRTLVNDLKNVVSQMQIIILKLQQQKTSMASQLTAISSQFRDQLVSLNQNDKSQKQTYVELTEQNKKLKEQLHYSEQRYKDDLKEQLLRIKKQENNTVSAQLKEMKEMWKQAVSVKKEQDCKGKQESVNSRIRQQLDRETNKIKRDNNQKIMQLKSQFDQINASVCQQRQEYYHRYLEQLQRTNQAQTYLEKFHEVLQNYNRLIDPSRQVVTWTEKQTLMLLLKTITYWSTQSQIIKEKMRQQQKTLQSSSQLLEEQIKELTEIMGQLNTKKTMGEMLAFMSKYKTDDKTTTSVNQLYQRLKQLMGICQKLVTYQVERAEKSIAINKDKQTENIIEQVNISYENQLRQQHDKLKSQYNRYLQKTQTQTKSILATKQQQNIRSTQEIQRLSKSLAELTHSLKQIQAKYSQQMEKNAQKSSQFTDWMGIDNENKIKIEQLHGQVGWLNQEISNLTQQIFQLKQQKQSLQTKTKLLQRQKQQQKQAYQSQSQQLRSTKNSELQSLKRFDQQKQQLKLKLNQSRVTYQNQINKLKLQIQNWRWENLDLNTSLEAKQEYNSKKQAQITKLKGQVAALESVMGEVAESMAKKLNLNKQIKISQLLPIIDNFKSDVGLKLITSTILLGMDSQRSSIISKIQQFSQQRIKRSDILFRYDLFSSKSMIQAVPKDTNNFAFVMLYKTKNGRIFGSFSLGIKKETFIFNLVDQNEGQSTESKQKQEVNFYVPCTKASKIVSIEIVSGRFLTYGANQLKICLTDVSTISANSDVIGQNYYNNNWKVITNQQEQKTIQLAQVQIHRIEFQ